MKAPIPADEGQRLLALQRYEILDTLPEEAFDRFTRLASQVVGGEIVLVSFVDAERQWFKARRGTEISETPREVAFCAYTILSDDILTVEDATRDRRFQSNPLVTGPPGIRFYAAAPIKTPDGFRIGTLCTISPRPHAIPPDRLPPLKDLAGLLANELELRQASLQAERQIEEQKKVEQRLAMSEARLRDFLDAASDWLWETDAEHAFTLIAGHHDRPRFTTDYRGKTRWDFVGASPETDAFWRQHKADLDAHRPFKGLVYAGVGLQGREQHLEVSGTPFFNTDGRFAGYRGTARDVTHRVRAERQLQHMALHDQLTGLPNRVLMRERLAHGIAHARRDGTFVAITIVDVDDFKLVNDTLGHAAGDQLLCQISARIAESIRDTDILARLGGDEFALVQADIKSVENALDLVDRVLAVMVEPFAVDGQELHVRLSLGTAVFPGDGEDPDTLLRHADLALYRAKAESPGGARLFEPGMDVQAQTRRRLESDLRSALEREEFELYYQPQFRLATGTCIGAEALLRWHHPARGFVSPDSFIPLAESTGLIRPLGEWVLAEACRQLALWREAGLALGVSVNLSPVQLRTRETLALVDRLLARHSLPAGALELEITEGVLVELAEREMGGVLFDLAGCGLRLAIDDFGVGYSSLAYLQRLPVHRMKIDRSFVANLDQGDGQGSFIAAIVGLGRSLGKLITAEGVETRNQLELLRNLGCDDAQGFYLGRPVPAAELQAALTGAAPAPRPPRATADPAMAGDAGFPPAGQSGRVVPRSRLTSRRDAY